MIDYTEGKDPCQCNFLNYVAAQSKLHNIKTHWLMDVALRRKHKCTYNTSLTEVWNAEPGSPPQVRLVYLH